MGHALAREQWNTLLPPIHNWLHTATIKETKTAVDGAHYGVVVRSDQADKDKVSIDAPDLDDGLKAKLLGQANTLGWRPSAGPLHLNVDQNTYTLVAISSVPASLKQVARQVGLDLAKALKELKLKHLVLCSTSQGLILDIAEGYISGLYTQAGFKGQRKNDQSFPPQLSLLGGVASSQSVRDLVEFSKAQVLVRFLQDAPPNYLTPKKFAGIAQDIAKEYGLVCKVLGREAMETLGMDMFLSVANGSVEEPQCITIEIPGVDNSKTVALVGKGLTFDSGGISIKGSAGMEEMKYDMSGGAAVLGVVRYFAAVKPPVKVICVIGATENMPSGAATKPSDVVKAYNGKTVEILNTDAEGRLVLGDCLSYTINEYKPDFIADIATLTGAVLMALGCVGGAVFGSDESVAQRALKAAELGGEPFWQLPLWPELEKEVKGDTADLKNIAKANVKGGTIMAAWFLKEFVGQTPWAHFDIAGTAWNCQALGYPSSGSAAFGFRTLVNLCKTWG